MEISDDEKKRYIKRYGWETWYNKNYWIHPQTVQDEKKQDYTAHGMSLSMAYAYQIKINSKKGNYGNGKR